MTRPPNGVEALLEALGAEREFRDGVLGDLAEEFAARADRDGSKTARRWYWREALRAAPHLLFNWSRRLGVRGGTRLVGVMVVAYASLLVLGLAVGGIGYAALRAVGAPTNYRLPWDNPIAAALMLSAALALGVVISILNGYLVARLDTEAPVASAVACGLAWGCIEIIVVMFAHQFPMWYRLAIPIVVSTGTAAGGVIAVLRNRKRATPAIG